MRAARSFGWLLALVVGSLAMAGLVLALDHPPSGGDRPELSAQDRVRFDRRVAALLPSLQAADEAAATMVEAGGTALVALRGGDAAAALAAIAAGESGGEALAAAAAEVGEALPGLLEGVDPEELTDAARDRAAALGEVPAAAEAMAVAWADVEIAAASPAAWLDRLASVDAAIEEATDAGRAGRFAEARSALEEARVALGPIVPLREAAAAAGREVTPLTTVIDAQGWRIDALEELYRTFEVAGPVRTPAVEAALAEVDAAEATLAQAIADPAVAVEALGANDITGALLDLEAGRGTLAEALGG